jgi:hypothetical protein
VTWGRFFVHFFHGKSLSAENSAEFLGKTIFQNFFRGKFHFFPTFFGRKFSAEFSPKFSMEFSPKFSPEKMYEKLALEEFVEKSLKMYSNQFFVEINTGSMLTKK